MFDGCSKITNLNVSNFNTSNVKYMNHMFNNCKALTTITGLNNFNPSSVISMGDMFWGCSSLTNINFGTTSRTLSNLTTMKEMFYGCSKLTEIRMGGWTTDRLTDCSYMFYNCSSLKTLLPTDMRPTMPTNLTDTSGWLIYNLFLSSGYPRFTTTAVTNVSSMFAGCTSLEDLYGVSLQGNKITNMSAMFFRCTLTKINTHFWNNDNFGTTSATSFSDMFSNCSSLTELNLSKFTINNGATVTNMLSGCTSLGDIYAPKTGSSISITLPSGSTTQSATVGDRYWFKKGALTAYNSSYSTSIPVSTTAGTIFSRTKVYLESNWKTHFNTAVGSSSSSVRKIENATKLVFDGGVSPIKSENGGYSKYYYMYNTAIYLCHKESFTDWKISSYYTIVAPASLASAFASCSKLTTLAFDNFDTSLTTNMSKMFQNCSVLTSLSISNFDTSNVTDMGCMFEGCKVLTTLDLSGFNTAKVTSMAYMFKNCNALLSLNVSSFDTSLVTTMQETMRGLTSYTGTLDLSKWKIKKSCNMSDFMVDSTKISTFYTPCRIASSQDTTIGIRMKANYYDNYNSSNVNSGSLFYPDTVTHRLTKR